MKDNADALNCAGETPRVDLVAIDQSSEMSAGGSSVGTNQCAHPADSTQTPLPTTQGMNCDDRPVRSPDSVAIEQSCETGMRDEVGGMREDDLATPSPEVVGRKERAKETRRRRCKGLGGLQQEKTGIWTLRCKINGKRIAKSTGTRDRAEAEQFAKRFLAPYVKDDAARTFENIQAAVMTERQLAEMREAEGPQMKLTEAWAAYVASPMRRDLAQTTIMGKEQVCRKFLEYMAKVFPEVTEVRHLTRYHTEHYLDYLRKDHSASTYNNRLCVLREVHRTIMEKAAAKTNPWEGFPLRADDSHTRRELTIEELARLVEMASREGPEWRTLFGIAMYTGLRLGDCCHLKWENVNLERGIIQVVPEKTKKHLHGRPVTIPIHPSLMAELEKLGNGERGTGNGEWSVYVNPKVAEYHIMTRWRVDEGLRKIFNAAGITMSVHVEGRKRKHVLASFHSLRHTFVSISANAGVPLPVVQSIVGHCSSAMTRHYYHENLDALRRAVDAIPAVGHGEWGTGNGVTPPFL